MPKKRFYIPGTRHPTVLRLEFPGDQWATNQYTASHVMTIETFIIQK